MADSKLEDTKCDIRSVLLTAPRGLDLHKFCQEYKAIVGQPVPFQAFGYRTVEEFLYSIPDVVQMQWCQMGNTYLLRAVADKSTKHIEKLVSKQKVSKQNNPLSSLKKAKRTPVTKKKAGEKLPPRLKLSQCTAPSIPASVRVEIVRLLEDYTDGIMFSNFLSAYRKKYGKELAYEKMGFFHLHACFEQIPEVQCEMLNGEPQIFLSSSKRSAPVTRRNGNFEVPPRFSAKPSRSELQQPSTQFQPPLLMPEQKQEPNALNYSLTSNTVVQPSGNNELRPGWADGYLNSARNSARASPPDKPAAHQFAYSESTPNMLDKGYESNLRTSINRRSAEMNADEQSVLKAPVMKSSRASISDHHATSDVKLEGEVSEKMKQNFCEILRQNPCGLWCADLPEKYKELTGNSLELTELGYYSVLEMVDKHPDIFMRFQPEDCKSDWLLFDSSAYPDSLPVSRVQGSINSNESSRCATVSLLADVISNVRRILQATPEGIFLDEFIHMYSLNCEQPLVLSEFGFNSVETFLLSILKSVPLKIKYSDVRKKVYYDSGPGFLQPKGLLASSNALYSGIPEDAVIPRSFYTLQTLPEDLSDYIPLYIGTIDNPSRMWIQLRGDSTSGALAKLMEDLDCFYTSAAGDQYIMQDYHIQIGAVCAGIWSYDGAWHRISITGLTAGVNYVDATFVDYGTRAKVVNSNLRFLKSEFFELPAQAIQVKMAYMKPISGTTWDVKARDRLLQIAGNKPLMGQIVYEEDSSGTPSVFLCDVSEEEDVYLNNVLIEEGYAVDSRCAQPSNNEHPSSIFSSHVHAMPFSAPFGASPPIPQPSAFTQSAQLPDVNTMDVLKAMAILMQYKAANTVTQNEALIEILLRMLSLNSQGQGSSAAVAAMQHLMSTGFDPQNLLRLLNIAPNLLSGAGIQNNLHVGNQGNQTGFASGQQNQVGENANSAEVPSPTARPGKSQPSTVLPKPSGNVSTAADASLTENQPPSEDGDSDDIFDSEEEDELLENLSSEPSSQRYVKRVKLRDGYRIHVIAVDKLPYVSCCDISRLFWPSEAPDCLYRRLRNKDISITVTTISEAEYPDIFRQLRCTRVAGIEEKGGKAEIMLYPLKSLIDILNIFGHPSPSIRDEVDQEIRNFNESNETWTKFSAVEEEDDDGDDSDTLCETDSDKFQRMCIYDLKATIEGLRFKRLKLMKSLVGAGNVKEQVEEIKKIENQKKIYERRIKEIEAISKSYKSVQN